MNSIVTLRPEPNMPPEAPLALPEQDLRHPFHDPDAPAFAKPVARWFWRAAVFLPPTAATLLIVALFTDFFAMGGLSLFEMLLIGLIAFTFFWIAMSVSMAIVGTFRSRVPAGTSGAPMDVALIMPIHEEMPDAVFGNALAMIEELSALASPHRFSLFILSDTKTDPVAEDEARAFAALRALSPHDISVHYRRFPDNTDRKIGNIGEWVRRWGGAYEAMVVLDADSLMSAETLNDLASAMASDPSAGLIQSTPRIIEAETLLGRIQQFSTAAYGPLLSAGLAAWTGSDGNYWGHNAIIRSRAFATAAGLPRIGRSRQLVLSHDFVEAALLRRAGWSVRMLPVAEGSYEEAPETLIDYVKRDSRWCRGNLQHLRLLATKGLHPVSRFHLFQGAMSYLVSPLWLALLLIWAGIGVDQEKSLIVYFSGNDPRPHWPELTGARQIALLAVMYGMLLAPKLMGVVRVALGPDGLAGFGGAARFAASFVIEVLLSVAYAPILMVQQTRAVAATALGLETGWSGYRGAAGRGPSLGQLAKFHAAETVIGAALVTGILLGYVTPWLWPIAASLALAVPLSRLSAVRLSSHPVFSGLMATPEAIRPPSVILKARAARQSIGGVMRAGLQMAAE